MPAKLALITGVTGQDGAYLSQLLLSKGIKVVGLGRSYDYNTRYRLELLGIANEVEYQACDLTDAHSVTKILNYYQPDEIYNLAAQSSVGISFAQPLATIHFNTVSVLNLLEAVRDMDKQVRFYHASSSEMFGRLEGLPVTENTIFHPISPYAVSKLSAHLISRNYREAYGMHISCGILFNHESHLRSPNFFIKKVIQESVKIYFGKSEHLRVGHIDLKRDFGYAPRYVEAMWLMLQQDQPDDYLICSGKSVSLRDIIHHVFKKLDIDINRLVEDKALARPLDIDDLYGDNTKARVKLGWNYDLSFFEVLDMLIDEEICSMTNSRLNIF